MKRCPGITPLKSFAAALFLMIGMSGAVGAPVASADDTSRAVRLHKRLTGLAPSPATTKKMVELLGQDKAYEAALIAIDGEDAGGDKQSGFWNIVLKDFFNRDFNKDGLKMPLNDGIALGIAMTRYDKDFRGYLYENLTARGANWDPALDNYTANGRADPVRLPAPDSNAHYEQLERRGADLKKDLILVPQTTPQFDPTAMWAGHGDAYPAGVLTTRAFASVYYLAGTNRAAVRFSLKNYLCADIEEWHDTTIPDNEVRRDPDRTPGDDPSVYRTKCAGCHAGMDPLSRAFAYLDWDANARKLVFTKPLKDTPFDKVQCARENNQLVAEVTLNANSSYEDKLQCAVAEKYLNNKETYAEGYVVKNDNWMNQWTDGHNARAGWAVKRGEKIYGTGPKQYGRMLAQSREFARCMPQRALKHLCLVKDFENRVVQDKWERLTEDFVESGYKMKEMLAAAATMCLGD